MAIVATIDSTKIERLSGGIIKLPIALATDDASACQVEILPDSAVIFATRSGQIDNLDGLEHAVYFRSDNNFDVLIQVPAGRQGGFNIDIEGNVFCRVMNSMAQVVSATAVDVAYDLRVPTIDDTIVPESFRVGSRFYIIWKFGPKITLVDPAEFFRSGDATYLDLFDFAGANLGLPTLYLWQGVANPVIPPPLTTPTGMPDATPTLPAEWKPATKDSAETNYIMMYWNNVIDTAAGFGNIRIRDNVILGPVV